MEGEYLQEAATPHCTKAVVPTYLRSVPVTIPKGDTDVHMVFGRAEGEDAIRGVRVHTATKCDHVMITIGVVGGDNCKPCDDPDELTITEQTRPISAMASFRDLLKDTWVAYIKVHTIDNAFASTAAMQDVNVWLEAEYSENCAGCPVPAIPAHSEDVTGVAAPVIEHTPA